MSETIKLPTDAPTDNTSDLAPTISTALNADRGASAPVPAQPAPPTDARALLELIASALAPDAEEATRAGAREALVQLAHPIPTAPPAIHAAPLVQSAPTVPGALVAAMSALPIASSPSSTIAMAARALRGLPPDQLLEIVLQRLRAALPAGATVAAPNGIQFQLVPVTPPAAGSR